MLKNAKVKLLLQPFEYTHTPAHTETQKVLELSSHFERCCKTVAKLRAEYNRERQPDRASCSICAHLDYQSEWKAEEKGQEEACSAFATGNGASILRRGIQTGDFLY